MRIASIEAFPVRPRTLKEGYADDGPWPARFPVFLVRVTTEDGRVGTGEATSQVWYLGETGAQIRAALRLYDDALRGADPEAIGVCHQRMEAVYAGGMPGARAARCGVDLALHDLVGRARGVPVHILLGGARRERLTQLTNLYHDTPEAMADACRDFAGRGFGGLKIKVGEGLLRDRWSWPALQRELDKLQAALEAVPTTVMIDADANQGWRSPQWTVVALRRFADHPNLSIEQPLHYEDLDGAAFVRARAGVPLILDESARSPEAVSQIIRTGAADRVVIKLNRVGGLYPALQIVTLCEAAGIGVSVDTSPFTPVGDSASAHLAAVIPTPYPVDCEGHVSFLEMPSGLVEAELGFEAGEVLVPQAPGLGVSVDWAALAALDTAERTEPPFTDPQEGA